MPDFEIFNVQKRIDCPIAGNTQCFFATFFEPLLPVCFRSIRSQGRMIPVESNRLGIARFHTNGIRSFRTFLLQIESNYRRKTRVGINQFLAESQKLGRLLQGKLQFKDQRKLHQVAHRNPFRFHRRIIDGNDFSL